MTGQFQFENILLVDDDEISCIITSTILKEAQITQKIQSVYNGKQAIDFLKRQCEEHTEEKFCPALLFLDLNMPVMDGFEFLSEYTKDEELSQLNLSIIVLTSSAHTTDRERAYTYPIAGFITKPITKQKLESILANRE